MRKLLLSTILMACSAAFVVAQSVDKFTRVESFHGYSYFLLERPSPLGEGNVLDSFHGVNSAVTLNVKRHFGLKFDFTRYKKRARLCLAGAGGQNLLLPSTECFSLPLLEDDSRLKTSIYNVMGGIQLKNNSNDAKLFKPFAHLLIGSTLTREETRLEVQDPRSGQFAMNVKTVSDSGFTGAVGGGFDIRMTERMDFRAIQVDYQKATLFAHSTDNLRFGVGLVFR